MIKRRASASKEVPEGYAIDKETGKLYKVIPKVHQPNEGHPDIAVDDFDINDLSKEADNFLGPLRSAPSKEEIRELREKKKRMQLERERALEAEKDERSNPEE